MKKWVPYIICIMLVFGSCDAWWISGIDTAKEVNWLTETEKTYIRQINKVRTNPRAYARTVVQNSINVLNTEISERKKNGLDTESLQTMKALVQDVFNCLKLLPPMEKMEPALGLTLACRDQCSDPGQDGHSSTSPGSEDPWSRAAHYSSGASAEIAWPVVNGEEAESVDESYNWSIVLGWLIDYGESNRPKGHRYAILNRELTRIGIAFGPKNSGGHSVYALLARNSYNDLAGVTPSTKHADVTWPVLRVVEGTVITY